MNTLAKLAAALALSVATVPVLAESYTDLSSFEAVSATTVLDLDDLVPAGEYAFYGNPGSLDLGPLSVWTNGPLFAQNNDLYGTGGFLSPQQGGGGQSILFSFENPISAFGFHYSPGEFLIFESDATTIYIQPSDLNSMAFFGYTSIIPFSSAWVHLFSDGMDLDNLRYGEVALSNGAVPEPATWALMILGFGALGGVMRRRVRHGEGAGMAAA